VNVLLPQANSHLLAIISAMITPSILILGAGSLVASTLTRLSRVVDRARVLIDRVPALAASGDRQTLEVYNGWLRAYRRRGALAERALQAYYCAIGLFVASSLSIMIDSLTGDKVPWLALGLVVAGSACLFAGTAALVIETNMATGLLRREIEHAESQSMLPPVNGAGFTAAARRQRPPEN
jgi:Protein of unknown function (DUF2721)